MMNISRKIFLLLFVGSASLIAQPSFVSSDILSDLINQKKLELFPVTKDFRNYFILQSIDDQTNIIIGDFVGAERKIVLIEDLNSDNTIDHVYEYYPDSKKKITPSKPSTDLFEGLEKTKRKIITGEIFRTNYSYNMRSLDVLERRLKKGSDIFKSDYGYSVKVFDPDRTSTIMSEFFFGRKAGRYSLQFKTDYYKLYNNSIRPAVPLSVYCVNSKDPVVKETVENLINTMENK